LNQRRMNKIAKIHHTNQVFSMKEITELLPNVITNVIFQPNFMAVYYVVDRINRHSVLLSRMGARMSMPWSPRSCVFKRAWDIVGYEPTLQIGI